MMEPQSRVLQQLLVQQGLVTDPDGTPGEWPCYLSSAPDGDNVPTNVVTLYDTPALKKGRIMRTGFVVEDMGVQIKVRGHDFPCAWRQMDFIRAYLDSVKYEDFNYKNFIYLVENTWRMHGALDLGLEPNQGKRRHNVALNVFLCLREVGPIDSAFTAACNKLRVVVNNNLPADFPPS